MTKTDYIQLAILAVLMSTLVPILVQTRTQSRMLRYQVLRDRFETFWQTVRSNVSADDLLAFHSLRDDYIDASVYRQSYEGNEEKIRRYMRLLNLYDWLAFSFSIREMRPDDLLEHFAELWSEDLLDFPEFLDVHKCHKEYYPKFAKFVDDIMLKQQGKKNASQASSEAA